MKSIIKISLLAAVAATSLTAAELPFIAPEAVKPLKIQSSILPGGAVQVKLGKAVYTVNADFSLQPGWAKFKADKAENFKGKKVYLEFSARCHQSSQVAGYTGMLKVWGNGTFCRDAELVKPLKRSKTGSGGEIAFARNGGYVVYYSNACYGISEDSNYCPVSLEDRNPFNFRLDITRLVKDKTTVKFENTLPARVNKTIYIDNPVLVTE